MLMIHGLNAIKRTPCEFSKASGYNVEKQNYSLGKHKMTRAETRANNIVQKPVVEQMCKEGCGIGDIVQATKVSRSQIHLWKKELGLIRPSLAEYKKSIKKLLIECAPYTHSLSTLSALFDIDKIKTTAILRSVPQVEKGTTDGLKRKYRYNFDIKVGDGATSCGKPK